MRRRSVRAGLACACLAGGGSTPAYAQSPNDEVVDFGKSPETRDACASEASHCGTDATEPGKHDSGLDDICAINPDACPERNALCATNPSACPQSDLCESFPRACRELPDGEQVIYAAAPPYDTRGGRVELAPLWSVTLDDRYGRHAGPGFAAQYFATPYTALGASVVYYEPYNAESRRAASDSTWVDSPRSDYAWGAALETTFIVGLGKFWAFNERLVHWDLQLVGAMGVMNTRPSVGYDGAGYVPRLCGAAGVGSRFFVSRSFGVTLWIRDTVFRDGLGSRDAHATDGRVSYDERVVNDVEFRIVLGLLVPYRRHHLRRCKCRPKN